MEYGPNSHPERTGNFMTGTVTDSCIGHRSPDIGPDTNIDCCIEPLIRKRAQSLKDDREHLNDCLHRYIEQRAIQKWSPPKHPSYNQFDARLKSFDRWLRRPEQPTHQSLAEAGFFFASLYIDLRNLLKINSIVNIVLISHISLQETLTIRLAFIAGWVYMIGLQLISLSSNTPVGRPFVSTFGT
jgi:hypothetical protein